MAKTAFSPSKLIKQRAISGLKQWQVAEAAGLSSKQLSRYETGDSTPREVSIHKLANALQCEFEDLVSTTEDDNQDENAFFTLIMKIIDRDPGLITRLIESKDSDPDIKGEIVREIGEVIIQSPEFKKYAKDHLIKGD